MLIYTLLFIFGIFLSAFFSGSETGLYRAPRVRLVLDSLAGHPVSRGLLWLADRPTLFVATVLVGNNAANYITSFAVVKFVPLLFGSHQAWVEFAGSVLVTPVVFVYGELLPKFLYFHAPSRLLRFSGPLLMLATVLFLPITLLLGLLGSLLTSFTGKTPFQSRVRMARDELQQVLRDGKAFGLLKASQQKTAENIWHVGEQSAKAFAMPPDRLARIPLNASPDEAIAAARRHGHPLILVEDPGSGDVIGFVRYADLASSTSPMNQRLNHVVAVDENAKNLEVLFALNDKKSDVAKLVNAKKAVVAIVTRRQLLEPLMTH